MYKSFPDWANRRDESKFEYAGYILKDNPRYNQIVERAKESGKELDVYNEGVVRWVKRS